VLDVKPGQLCWVAGTVYMEMSLKPNILDDISKDVGQLLVQAYISSLIDWAALGLGTSTS